MTHGAMRATLLTLVKLKRKQKGKKGKRERERNGEKERRGEREGKWALPFLYDVHRSGGWISSGQELKLIYLARARCGHRNQGVSTQFRISDFREVKSFRFRKCPRDFLEFLLPLKR